MDVDISVHNAKKFRKGGYVMLLQRIPLKLDKSAENVILIHKNMMPKVIDIFLKSMNVLSKDEESKPDTPDNSQGEGNSVEPQTSINKPVKRIQLLLMMYSLIATNLLGVLRIRSLLMSGI